jgi:translation initiation factor IF-3
VKVTCRFRGREITHPEMAARPLRFIVDRTKDVATVEVQPRMDGRTMTLILAPGTKGKAAKDLSIPTPTAPPPPPAPRRR